jgi:hypothetical protein
MEDVGKLYGHLVYIFYGPFGIFCGYLVYIFYGYWVYLATLELS